ncbi:isochorismatase family domain-containing protein [Ditylenchus destructor]|uniref:Isochorismatase family domain-containing protein n=1 Tax=Ditylenchus destructor TaxID=166010 RepID=A0AAD4R214_9BILA|nr:isochorismatase family domain-containing protein [Ditylenchus destructor]
MTLNLAHAVLLVIDMQVAFQTQGQQVLNQVNETISQCRQANLPIVFTQFGHKYVPEDCGVLCDFWGTDGVNMVGSPSFQLMSGLDVQDGDIIVEKYRYDAFYGTVLSDMLRVLKVDTVIVTGVKTNICCETTARSAFSHDFKVVFVSDATAANTEALHNATLLNIANCIGKVVTRHELYASLPN